MKTRWKWEIDTFLAGDSQVSESEAKKQLYLLRTVARSEWRVKRLIRFHCKILNGEEELESEGEEEELVCEVTDMIYDGKKTALIIKIECGLEGF